MIGVQRAVSSAMKARVCSGPESRIGSKPEAIRMRWKSGSATILRVASAIWSTIGLRYAGRREQAVEIAGHHAGEAGFDRGRNVGRALAARGRIHRQDADLAGAVEAEQRAAEVRRHHRDMAAGEIGDAGRRALVGNVHDVGRADQLLEQLARQIGQRAGAGRAVGQLARIGLGVGDQLLRACAPAPTRAPRSRSASCRRCRRRRNP